MPDTLRDPIADAPGRHLPHGISGGMTLLLAVACGIVVANIYYAQPLIALIAPDVGLSPRGASLMVALTQVGYAIGLVLLVPLGDLVENRTLVLASVGASMASLVLATLAHASTPFLLACLLIGLTSTAAQMVVPIAAHLATDASRGRVVGNVMSGLITGILLARPVASFGSSLVGWRGVLIGAVGLMGCLGVALALALPRRRPEGGRGYGSLLASLGTILRREGVLQRRAAYQAAMFGTFTLFWTVVPLLLASPRFGFGQRGIALFALAGAAGALSAPVAGRLGDRGLSRIGTTVAMGMVAVGFALALLGGAGPLGFAPSLALLVLAALLIDAGVQGNQIFGQRAIYSLAPAIRARLNGLYVAIAFLGGATASTLASPVYVEGGWTAICGLGILAPLVALGAHLLHRQRG